MIKRPRNMLAAVPVLCLLASAPSSMAHVFWLQPVAFRVAADEVVKLQTRVGDDFPGEVLPRDEKRIVRFVVATPDGSEPRPVVGVEGRDPMGMFRVSQPGAYIVGYQSNAAAVTLESQAFEAYLLEEGLNKIVERRRRDGTASSPGRERYSRCAKTIVLVGPSEFEGPTAAHSTDRSLGLRFELLPLGDMPKLRAGETLTVRALFEGKPLEGVEIHAEHPERHEPAIKVRTNAAGEAEFALPIAGMWRFNAVEMIPVSGDPSVDWESVWSSMTVEIPG